MNNVSFRHQHAWACIHLKIRIQALFTHTPYDVCLTKNYPTANTKPPSETCTFCWREYKSHNLIIDAMINTYPISTAQFRPTYEAILL